MYFNVLTKIVVIPMHKFISYVWLVCVFQVNFYPLEINFHYNTKSAYNIVGNKKPMICMFG